MNENLPLSRRTLLKGLGTAIALPFLDAMLPTRFLSRDVLAFEKSVTAPVRMAIFYVPNGVNMTDWRPARAAADYDLPPTLQLLEPFKKDLLVMSGLTVDKAWPNGDGAGDHARAASAFLTGCQARKTHGADIQVGVSVDQVAAAKVGHATRFPSLELGCDRGPQAGNCDSGYSCAYSANISWRTPSTPVAKEIDPRLVFERLFPNHSRKEAAEARARREMLRKSVLDFVSEDALALRKRLGATDQRKLDEYFAAVREVEQRIDRSEKEARESLDGSSVGRLSALTIPPKPEGIPKSYREHIRVLCDLLVIAFQANLTRVATFMLANEGSNRSYAFLDVPEGHHDLSHHGGDKEKQEKIAKINKFHMEQFAYFLDRLRAVKEGDGTLLDNSMVLYGSAIGDGNRHNHDDLPILLAGRGGGTLETGRHVEYPAKTPLNNLFLSMLDRMEAPVDSLGDSTGRLRALAAETRGF